MYGKKWDKHVDDCLPEIEMLQERFRVGSIFCETNGDKGYLAKELRERGLHVNAYAEHMNKFVKISTYLRKNWANIEWLEDTDPEYMDMILNYTEFAEHDDPPDSAASIIRAFGNETRFNDLRGFDL